MNIPVTLILLAFHMAAAASASICASRKTEWVDWNYLTSYGQSLSVGWTAKPVVTEKQEEGGLYMFRGGVRAYENGSDRKMLVPLEEGVNGPRGETPVSGAACRLFRLMQHYSPVTASRIWLICSATGVGGASLGSLGRGTGAYNRILDDLKAAQ